MNRLALLASGLSLAFASCANHDGELATEGKQISRLTIHQEGSGSIDEARLRSYISSTEGSTYSSQQIDTDIKSLYESGLVDDIRFRTEPDGNKVEVIAVASLRPTIGPGVGFVGNSIFSDQKLAKAAQIKPGEKATPETVARACRNISAFYRQHGHQATVTTRSIDHDETGTDFIFVIQEDFNSEH
jgi:outer membrane protein insertion porin family